MYFQWTLAAFLAMALVSCGEITRQRKPNTTYGESSTLNERIGLEEPRFRDLTGFWDYYGWNAFHEHESALAFARNEKAPVFAFFTGYSIGGRRVKEYFFSPELEEYLAEEVVLLVLYADEPQRLDPPLLKVNGEIAKRYSDYAIDFQTTHFHTIAQPYFVLLDPFKEPASEWVLTEPIGYCELQELVEMLEAGLGEFDRRHP